MQVVDWARRGQELGRTRTDARKIAADGVADQSVTTGRMFSLRVLVVLGGVD